MENEKFIISFSIKAFIDAQKKFYDYDGSIDSKKESLKEWDKYVKAINQNKVYDMDIDRLRNLAKQENKNNQRLDRKKILDKIRMTYLNKLEFDDFANSINCDYDIEVYEDRVKDGIRTKKQIIKILQKGVIEDLDIKLVESNQFAELPISKECKEDLILNLSKIMFYQFLENQKEPIIKYNPSVNESKQTENKKTTIKESQNVKLNWVSDKQVLYWLFAALKDSKLISNTYVDIAKMIHQNFNEMPESVKTIETQLKQIQTPMKVKDIDEIILILKKLKIKGLE